MWWYLSIDLQLKKKMIENNEKYWFVLLCVFLHILFEKNEATASLLLLEVAKPKGPMVCKKQLINIILM